MLLGRQRSGQNLADKSPGRSGLGCLWGRRRRSVEVGAAALDGVGLGESRPPDENAGFTVSDLGRRVPMVLTEPGSR